MEESNNQTQTGDMLTGDAAPPQTLGTKPGYLTSQFGLTATFTLVCLVLGWFGIQQTPEQIEGYLGLVERVATALGPIIAAVVAIVTYTNSRGKIASNTVNANSAIQVASLAGLPGLGAILGGKNWKDPKRYMNIADLVGNFVPAVGQVTDAVHRGPTASRESQFTEEEMRILKNLLANAGK